MIERLPQPFGRYMLTRRIGEGGMAEVFQANVRVAEGLTKWVVIKKIRKDFATQGEFTRMFVDEAKIALSLNHANIVQVFDFGQIGTTFYLAMELIEGVDLMSLFHAVRARGDHFPPEIAAYIAHQVAAGLSYVHRKTDDFGRPLGIVHRDITPHNIMISYDGQVKVLDFGIARAAGPIAPGMNRAEQETIKGKVAYMSPEQAMGGVVDSRSDLYSLGVVLYELLTGELLYRDKDRMRALENVRTRPIPPLLDRAPEAPVEMARVLDRVLARESEQRIATAREFQSLLANYLHNAPNMIDEDVLGTFLLRYRTREYPPSVRIAAEPEPATAEIHEAEGSEPVPGPRRRTVKATLLSAVFSPASGEKSESNKIGYARFLDFVRDLAFKRDANLVALNERGALLAFGILPTSQDEGELALRTALSLRETIGDMASGLGLATTIMSTQVAVLRRPDGAESIHLPAGLAEQLERTTARYIDERVMVSRDQAERLSKAWRFGPPILVQGALTEADTYAPWQADLQEFSPFIGPLSEAERRSYLNVAGRRPLYGRDLELKAMRDCLADVIRSVRSRGMMLVGGAGFGKRTLVDRFLTSLPAGSCVVLRGAGLWVYRNQPLGVFLEILRRFLAIESNSTTSDVVAKIAHYGIAEAEHLGRNLAMALGLPDGGETLEADNEGDTHIVRLLRRLIRALAMRRPVILVIDNLHFVDDQSLAILEEWSIASPNHSVMGLFTVRPGSRAEALLRKSEPSGIVRIELGELDERSREELIIRRFENPDEARDLAESILARTGGHPLFIEETLASLLRRGVIGWNAQGRFLRVLEKNASVEILPSIEAALADRIDALDDLSRLILQAGAVLGRRFRVDEVVRMVGEIQGQADEASTKLAITQAINALFDERLIESDPTPGPNGVERMRFATVSLHEVCRQNIPSALVSTLHTQAATLKLQRADYKQGRDDGPIADHLTHAGKLAQSIDPALRAARHARDVAGNVEAFYYLSLALKALAPDDPRRFDALLDRERILRAWARTRAQGADIRHLSAFAERYGTREQQVIATIRLIRFYIECSRIHRAEKLIPNVEAVLPELDHPRGYRALLGELQSLVCFARREFERAETVARDSLEHCTSDNEGQRVRARLLICVGNSQLGNRQFGLARATFREVLELARATQSRRLEAEALNHLGSVAGLSTRYQEAVEHYRAALAIDRELGDRYATGIKLANLGIAYTVIGLYQRAEKYLRKAMELHAQIGHAGLLNDVMINLGDAVLGQGDRLSALELYKDAAKVARNREDVRRELRARAKYASTLVHAESRRDEINEAAVIANQVISEARGIGSRTSRVRGLHIVARIAEADGDLQRAVSLEEEAVELVSAGAAPVEGVLSVHHLGLLLVAGGQVERGREYLQRAAETVEGRLQELRDAELRRGYLDQVIVRRILEDGGRMVNE
jgi:serine/threonine protein kinase/predicted ATPase